MTPEPNSSDQRTHIALLEKDVEFLKVRFDELSASFSQKIEEAKEQNTKSPSGKFGFMARGLQQVA